MNNKAKTLFEYIIRARKNVLKRNKAFTCKDEKSPAGPPDKGSWKTWRTLSVKFAIPMILVGTLFNIVLLAMCGETQGPPYVPYEYMYRRVRRFPWGDGEKSLFHNPDANALPDGYEPGRGPTQRYSEDMDDDQQEPPPEREAEEEEET